MKEERILRLARKFIRSRRYGDAIRLLEPEVVRFRDSHQFYILIGLACLYSGDAGGALTYFRRAKEIKPRDVIAVLGIAVLHLRRGETDKAVEFYLEVQELSHRNHLAKKALRLIRKKGDPDVLSAWLEKGSAARFYPRMPWKAPEPGRVIIASVFGLAIAATLFAAAWFFRIGPFESHLSPARMGFDAIRLEQNEKAMPVESGGAYRYILTRKEVIDEYEAAQNLFLDNRDEAAKMHVNRILESNASATIKRKARVIAEYAAAPGFDTLKDFFDYGTVSADPFLYRDCAVVWKGMATNLTAQTASTTFQFLVGYDTRSTLLGIVPVHFDTALNIDVDKPLEILGLVKIVDGRLELKGISIHQAAGLPTPEKAGRP